MYSLWRQPLNVGLDDLFWPSPIFAVDQNATGIVLRDFIWTYITGFNLVCLYVGIFILGSGSIWKLVHCFRNN